jgi:hypothetical protein
VPFIRETELRGRDTFRPINWDVGRPFLVESMSESYRRVILALLIAALAAVSVNCTRERKAERRPLESSALILRYQDFGPQVVSHEALGMEWYQWNSHGSDDSNEDDDVKVVVYRGVPLDEVKKIYPVIEGKQDYRYLEYKAALDLLDKYESDSFWDKHPDTRERMRQTRRKILEQLGR